MTWLSDTVVGRLQRAAVWPDARGTRYDVLEEIGRGGMGAVYRARDRALDRDVALKVVDVVGDAETLDARIRQEAVVLARLEHPGIVPVHDVGILADGRAFYVMKLVRGRSLSGVLAERPRLDERLRIFERIVETVAFAHAHGVLHRDLKPDNVMVGPFGEVLVLDWGLSTALGAPEADDDDADEREAPRLVAGTPGFMAPEQRQGRPVEARADVYALGALLFALLLDQTPPDSSAEREAALRAARVDRRLAAVCLKATAPSPEDRYGSAEALGDEVARFRAGLPVSAYRETVVERVARLAWTYRTPLLLIAAYLLMRTMVAFYMAAKG
ncbi:MAG: serine/threonine protein kinase [Vicinamibacteraceae bacterium]|nr:serine/threonine protein kinase [Vicinamibacteraceae bacterium]